MSGMIGEIMAEGGGFEPPIRFRRIHTFQACAFSHSATPPRGPHVDARDRGNIPNKPKIATPHSTNSEKYWRPLQNGVRVGELGHRTGSTSSIWTEI